MAERYMVPEVKVESDTVQYWLTIKSLTVACNRVSGSEWVPGETIVVNKVLEEQMGVFSLVFHTKYGTVRGRFRLDTRSGNIRSDWNCSDSRLHIDSFIISVSTNRS